MHKINHKITKKAEISNQTLGILLIAAISLSLLGTFVSINKVSQSPPIITLIGYAPAADTGSALVNLTVDQILDVNFTTASLDFGIGSVAPGEINCTVWMDTTPFEHCVGFSDLTGLDLILENLGNVNITVNISIDKNATTFIGGTSPAFEFSWQTAEPSSCRNTTGADQSWPNTPAIDHNLESVGGWIWGSGYSQGSPPFLTINSTNDYIICPNLDYAEASDSLSIGMRLVIPSDSFTGNLTSTITATAYMIDSQQ